MGGGEGVKKVGWGWAGIKELQWGTHHHLLRVSPGSVGLWGWLGGGGRWGLDMQLRCETRHYLVRVTAQTYHSRPLV